MTFEEWWAENGEAMLNVNLTPKKLASLAWNWGQTQQRERDAAIVAKIRPKMLPDLIPAGGAINAIRNATD